jgi:hypothetical protein
MLRVKSFQVSSIQLEKVSSFTFQGNTQSLSLDEGATETHSGRLSE